MRTADILVAACLCMVLGLTAAGGSIPRVLEYAELTWNCSGDAPPCPNCANRVPEGTWQNPYGCAPFVAHALAAGGYVPVSDCGDLDAYSGVEHNGRNYDLNVVSIHDPNCGNPDGCLTDFLMATGWKATSTVKAGTVCAVNGGDGPYTHVILGVGDNICDAHNEAMYRGACDQFAALDLCLDPPAGDECAGQVDGTYCNGVQAYECSGGKLAKTVTCSFVCIEATHAGKSFCAEPPGSCADTNEGNYCGNDKIGAPQYASVLFRCLNKKPIDAIECASGCQINAGTNDSCK